MRLIALYKQFARRRMLATCAVGVVAFVASGLVSLLVVPEPSVHDEFSYLLAADTFAHGRLANPPHPLHRSLETFHVLQQPNYVSKYQPGQGLFLALGQVLTGAPIVGVWISISLACAAICWMLQAWVPAEWAFVGAFFAIGRLCVLGSYDVAHSYWSNGFMGGGVPALGGALVFGAVRRLAVRASVFDSAILGLGLVFLALSRPLEGCAAVAVAGAYLLYVLWKKARFAELVRRLIPAVVALSCGAAFMLYYNYRTTGQPFLLPYVIYEQRYSSIPLFLWQPLRPPLQIGNAQMDSFNSAINIAEFYSAQHSFGGFILQVVIKLMRSWDFFLGEWLLIPFLVGCFAKGKSKWMQVALACMLVEAALVFGLVWFSPHYLAPITALIFLCIAQGLRRINQIPLGKRRGVTAAIFIVGFIITAPFTLLGEDWSNHDRWYRRRADIVNQLNAEPGKHLVMVHYGAHHTPYYEFVYNRADLDGAKVVWARSIDPAADNKVIEYYKDRHLWILEDDTELQKPCKATLTRVR